MWHGTSWLMVGNCTYLVGNCPYLDNQSVSVLLQQAIRVDYVKTIFYYITLLILSNLTVFKPVAGLSPHDVLYKLLIVIIEEELLVLT